MSLLCVLLIFFFFKQKTAYEMRISDWSSDVCSSDLASATRALSSPETERILRIRRIESSSARPSASGVAPATIEVLPPCGASGTPSCAAACTTKRTSSRSEEHTSELQSLMRISYAVFCLKKKKCNSIKTTNHTSINHCHYTIPSHINSHLNAQHHLLKYNSKQTKKNQTDV